VLGPTAVGKTAVAVQLAQYFQTSIISADSRQCFRELNIGVAKPSATELQLIHHYFINSHTVKDEMSAALFEQLALQWANEIFREKNVLIMVGGTGLYIKAFCEGLDDIPPMPLAMRNEIQLAYEKKGIAWLQEQIKEKDPLFYTTGEIFNPQRMIRALEVKLATGNSILSYRTNLQKQRPFDIVRMGLQLPKDQLHRNIDTRIQTMMEEGLVAEVEKLSPYRALNALRTVGYKELFDYLDGKISLEQAVEMIKKNTRQYAKRQITWFRKDPAIQWMHPEEVRGAMISEAIAVKR